MCRSKLHSSKMENIVYLWVHVSGEASYLDTQLSRDRVEQEVDSTTTTTTTTTTAGTPRQWWFSWWVVTITVQVMDLYMSLSQRLELIEATEYDCFYWYWDFICNAACHTMEKMRSSRLTYHQ